MLAGNSWIDRLLDRAGLGDDSAVRKLFDAHRARLRDVVALRLNDELQPRVDASDVVQETLVAAHAQLPDFAARRPVPFFVWLRQIAMDKLIELYRFHVLAQKRSVRRETPLDSALSGASARRLVESVVAPHESPLSRLVRAEAAGRGAAPSTRCKNRTARCSFCAIWSN